MALVTARLALVEFEGQRAARLGIRRVVCGVALGVCLVFMWALLLAGGIAWIAASLDQPWWQIALAASGVHLLAAMVLARALQAAVPPLFPVTRAEFHRDREWIENLHKSPKSDA